MVIALGIHLFPFRTEKLSPTTSMVLRKSGRVDSRRFLGVRAKVLREGSRFSFESAFFVSDSPFFRDRVLGGEFVLHDVMFDLRVMLVL